MKTKVCKRCEKRKKIDKFHELKNKYKRKDGTVGITHTRHAYCKPCQVEYRREKYGKTDYDQKYLEKNRERILEYQHEHYEKNKEKKKEQMYALYNRTRPEYLEKMREWKEKNPTAQKAHQKVQRAKRKGDLIVPDKCECCGRTIRVEFHHRSYEEPLKGLFLCRKMHKRWHGGIDQEAQELIRKLWKEKYNEEYDDFDGEIL